MRPLFSIPIYSTGNRLKYIEWRINMELNKEQEDALKDILDDKVRINKQMEKNKVIDDGKAIEWYAALINANIETRFELDRQLLAIASAAIGVLVTFMSDIKGYYFTGLWIFSGICFLTTILLALNIFKNNRYLLESIINGKEQPLLDDSLKRKDTAMEYCFIIGTITLFLLAVLKLNIFE